ncbi:hypothetical protein BKA93DRAFT_358544 [Sparassis latifolia]|uniref:Cation efflux protein transmembrane domain-containing protein n=1 Tax=Sparassis crispa TaxID=139825 RepID=A0A401GMK1_9APHY|nr:hypothetical protein SCP_0505200 [Sparassis crispa]GBE83471.1 hypothetical protein SCP_0505200 [Sparassis crispa]
MSAAGVQTNVVQIHRRKSSKEDDENILVFPSSQPAESPAVPPLSEAIGQRGLLPSEAQPRPVSYPAMSPSQSYPGQPGQYRPRPPSLNGAPRGRVAPAMRQSLSLPSGSHSRTRSVSGPFYPASPSPLSTSFPIHQPPTPGALKFPTSSTAPELYARTQENGTPPMHTRRHSRLHSRNLSVFFPRPGSLPHDVITEDGAQDMAYSDSAQAIEGVLMPSASPGPGQRTFRENFTFGARPPTTSSPHPMPAMSPSVSAGASRRGHHHKHSLSHNFFSFLEPGGGLPTSPDELHTLATPMPVSPWAPISPLQTPADEKVGSLHTAVKSPIGRVRASPDIPASAVGAAVAQFLLGVWLWISGQQVGSLSCTGLGYWVIFDALGVVLSSVLPGYLAGPSMRADIRRPFGNTRVETVVAFAQSVYLLFASVYVCKETVEHILLSSGEGHHHHHGDEVTEIFGIDFPLFLLCTTFVSLLLTSFTFNNHSKLVSTAGNHIPPLTALLPSRYRYGSLSPLSFPPRLANLLANPYTLAPLVFCTSILCTSLFSPPYQQRPYDLILAGFETVVTFSLAYSATVALGAVLLQTSPSRGLPGGRMEAFLRAMREIERHPQVLHLPAPHFWQLTPNLTRPQPYSAAPNTKILGPTQSLVVTVELHVRKELEDDEVLRLTRWAWERCSAALHFGTRTGEGGDAEAEVTVGIVRG